MSTSGIKPAFLFVLALRTSITNAVTLRRLLTTWILSRKKNGSISGSTGNVNQRATSDTLSGTFNQHRALGGRRIRMKKAADQKALVIATTDVSLFTKGEEIDLKLLFGMFEPHEKPWFVHEDKQGNMRVVVPDKNSDIFFAIPDPLHDGEMLAVLLVTDAVTYKGKKYES